MYLWCCWKDLDEQDLMELVSFGFRFKGDSILVECLKP
jgi:hypothetical protein